jgi:hypothetical protein
MALDHIAISGTPRASRRHAPGADPDRGGKQPRKMALMGKPGRYRNLGQRQVSDAHQPLGRLHALAKMPLVNAREKWLTERSKSAAICSNEGFPPRSDSNLSQARFSCPQYRDPRVHHEVAAFGGIGQLGCGGQYLRAVQPR